MRHRQMRALAARRSILSLGIAMLVAMLVASSAFGADPRTKRVSVKTGGGQVTAGSFDAVVSADGRFVAFHSSAPGLVPGDTNTVQDVFVHDRRKKRTRRVSVKSNGAQADGSSGGPALSASGRFIAFGSRATNLVKGDDNAVDDVFVHDRKTKKTRRVSVRSNGVEGNDDSSHPSISANGRYVAFQSKASNLVRNDDNGVDDVFVHDRRTGKTKRVSVRSNGVEGDDRSLQSAVSPDGRYVAFASRAENLVGKDDNGRSDVFVHDRKMKKTQRVSVKNGGGQAEGGSFNPSISPKGRYVAFTSGAANIVGNDDNESEDVFLRDRKARKTKRVSVRTDGGEGDGSSFEPAVSADGRFVFFATDATDLVNNDHNDSTDILRRDRKKKKTKRISVRNRGGESQDHSEDPRVTPDGRWVVFESSAKLVGADTNDEWDIYIRGPLR